MKNIILILGLMLFSPETFADNATRHPIAPLEVKMEGIWNNSESARPHNDYEYQRELAKAQQKAEEEFNQQQKDKQAEKKDSK